MLLSFKQLQNNKFFLPIEHMQNFENKNYVLEQKLSCKVPGVLSERDLHIWAALPLAVWDSEKGGSNGEGCTKHM
jgi:hypothetical protein